jgi:membrane protease YdiL (CAAX protease family)
MKAYNLLLSRLWPMSVIEKRPYRYACVVGAAAGLVSAVIGASVACLLWTTLPREILGPSAAADMSKIRQWNMLLMGVFFIPFWEMFIAQLLPLELAKMARFNDAACVALGAVVFGAGHYLNGGLGHGICSAISGALFSTGYMAMRACGYLPAFWTSYVAHAVNNFLLFFVVPLVISSSDQ